jgi:hypothetical protein
MNDNSITDIAGLYQQILGRAPDAGGAAHWAQTFGNTIDPTEIAQFRQAAAPELAITGYQNIPQAPLQPQFSGLEKQGLDAPPPPELYPNINLVDFPSNMIYDDRIWDWGLTPSDFNRPRNYLTPPNETTDYDRWQEPLKEIGVPEQVGFLPRSINSISDLYQKILNRAPDEAGLEYWKQQFGDTIDPNEIEQFRQAAAPELAPTPDIDFNRRSIPQAPNLVGGQGNEPPFQMGGQGGGVYEQSDGSRYVYKDDQWQYEPAPVAGTPDPTNPYISRGNQNLPEYDGRRDLLRTLGAPPKRDFPPSGNSVYDLYRQILEREPDADELAYWQQLFGDTLDPTEIEQFKEAAAPELYGSFKPYK